MPGISLPLSFGNSFWSQGYRTGLEKLYGKLQEGCAESEEVVNFINARVVAERNIASSLINPSLTGPRGHGFDVDDGASLLAAFRGLQAESAAQGEAHRSIARDLETLVLDPFTDWTSKHAERIYDSRTVLLEEWLRAYEQGQSDVLHLRNQYHNKTRQADEAEDDAKFAPNNDYEDKFTPRIKTNQKHGVVNRTPSMSERISQRLLSLKQHGLEGKEVTPPTSPQANASKVIDITHSPEIVEKDLPPLDKGKGRAEDPDAPPAPPKIGVATTPSIILAGVAFSDEGLDSIIEKAKADLPLRPIRFPIIGEYQNCFSGLEFVAWLQGNVKVLGDNTDKAELFARDLTERENALRRLGELGNRFDSASDAYYQFRTRAFGHKRNPTALTSPDMLSPTAFGPAADQVIKRSKTFISVVQQAVSGEKTSEPAFVQKRREAEVAEKEYQTAVRKLDRQRLALEERIEDTLRLLQRWESERLRALKTVLLQYQGTLATLPSGLQTSMEKSSTLIASYQPEQDLIALIERYRTGPFRPVAQVFESVDHECDVSFGIDLRQWAGEGGWNAIRAGEKDKLTVPYALVSLLGALDTAYSKLATDSERRKTWIYEVPLKVVHQIRETINFVVKDEPISPEIFAKYDAPILASTVKLWLLETNPPVGMWEGWDDIRKLYPQVGTTRPPEGIENAHLDELRGALLKLPRIHLLVLDTLIAHLKKLVESTEVELESREIFINKLALSLGRTILRPKFETQLSIQDRHPTLLFIDLLSHYEEILPPTLARKKRESDSRPIPVRKRTRPVDLRMSRSRLSQSGMDPQKLLELQLERKEGRSRNASPNRPTPVTPDSDGKHSITLHQEKNASVNIAESAHPTVPASPQRNLAAPPGDEDLPPRPMFKELVDVDDHDGTSPVAQRSVSPNAEQLAGLSGQPESPNSPGAVGLKRNTSSESTRLRGPRTARGPRPPSHVPGKASLSANDYAPRKKGGAVAAGAFSRRTQESDAEDDIVGR